MRLTLFLFRTIEPFYKKLNFTKVQLNYLLRFAHVFKH